MRPRRRIVRRAVMAVVVLGVVVAWFARREPPEIQRSRALRIGMNRSEVEAVMGSPAGPDLVAASLGHTVYYGQFQLTKSRWYNALCNWSGHSIWTVPHSDWPVRVMFQRPTGRVVRIERGDEVEEAPQR